jgi:DNA recombination protein RmuC
MSGSKGNLDEKITNLQASTSRIEPVLREEFARSREEISHALSVSRSELGSNLLDNRKEISQTLSSFESKFTENIKSLNDLQKNNFKEFTDKNEELRKETESKLEKIRETVEKRLISLQEENSQRLEKMQAIVDEKLQSTLEKRLSESFKQVSERLEQVHQGLGEMQNLAIGVGDLKKVLSNVKSRGILGEIQLGNILENLLTSDQYAKNVVTKKGSRENVEFAVKLPGRDDTGQAVYLPIDSKFPVESYHALLESLETANVDEVKRASKNIEGEMKKYARDIRDKYINPPDTTDFGILFLPFEGLYAEVVKQTSLIEILQREYKIIVTGPSTLSALLNSLQMGFRTVAIEKRTSEVWKVLSAVKTEFNKFGDVLKRAQEKIVKASEDIDQLVGTRTRQIQSKLKSVETLPGRESSQLLDSGLEEIPEEEMETD